MKVEHIPFSKLSDLYDNILTTTERDNIMNHLRICSACNREFNNLNKLLGMLSYLKFFTIRSEDEFVLKTLRQIKNRKKRSLLLKWLPSVASAASIVIILGIVLYNTGFIKDKNYEDKEVSNSSEEFVELFDSSEDYGHFQYREINSDYDISKTLQILKDYKVRQVRVFDSYIEGEIGLSKFNRLRSEFDYTDFFNINWNSNERNVAEAGLVDTGLVEDESVFSLDLNLLLGVMYNKIIRFRINCK